MNPAQATREHQLFAKLHAATLHGQAVIIDISDPAQLDLAAVLATEPETYRQDFLNGQLHRISRRDRPTVGEIKLTEGGPEQ